MKKKKKVILTQLELNIISPIVIKNATKYYYGFGLYTPLTAPTIITGITFADLLKVTKGKLTRLIA